MGKWMTRKEYAQAKRWWESLHPKEKRKIHTQDTPEDFILMTYYREHLLGTTETTNDVEKLLQETKQRGLKEGQTLGLYGANDDDVFPQDVEDMQEAGVEFPLTDDTPVDGIEPDGGWDAEFDNWNDG
jgi:hypothetical protein